MPECGYTEYRCRRDIVGEMPPDCAPCFGKDRLGSDDVDRKALNVVFGKRMTAQQGTQVRKARPRLIVRIRSDEFSLRIAGYLSCNMQLTPNQLCVAVSGGRRETCFDFALIHLLA